MDTRIRRLTADDFSVSAWSGGQTTQIAIAPEGARYGDRDFLWRVSSATVELDESDFTPLPDYRRVIATLSGEIRLETGDRQATLAPYEPFAFDGGDETRSHGRCTDFNLMLRKGKCGGTLEALRLAPGARVLLPLGAGGLAALLYCAEGQASVALHGERAALQRGEAVRLDAPAGELRLETDGGAALMTALIWEEKK